LGEVIYRLRCRNRRCRNEVVMYHTGREFIRALPRSLSALMFSNKSPEPTAVGAVSSAIAVHATSRRWLSFFR
jgi:hypothetical protein